MYTTALVTPPSALPAAYHDPSQWDIEKQARSHARAFVARTQELSAAQHVRAQVAAAELEEPLALRAERRRAEHSLADYIEGVVLPQYPVPWLMPLPHKLRACRQSGTLAQHTSGKAVVLWDNKCGQNRLCPDEARNETHRLIEVYGTAIEAYLRRTPDARLYSGVFTVPNFPNGKLRYGLGDIYRRFNKLRKKREGKKLVFPQIAGSLCIVEAPRSARGDWNVHMNVFLLCDSYLSFEQVRKHWYWNVELRQVKGTTEQIVKALKEGIKYAVKITPDKSAEKAEAGTTRAPTMTEWPASAWYEWWQAHQRYRRVRSYGALFLDAKHRAALDLPEDEGRKISDTDLTILGRVHFVSGRYAVSLSTLGLIREDNSIMGLLVSVHDPTTPPRTPLPPARYDRTSPGRGHHQTHR